MSMKLNGDVSNYFLKQVSSDILPKSIFNRPKHSFSVPIGKWLEGSLRDLMRDLMAHGILRDSGVFSEWYISGQLWDALERNEPGIARQFWNLISLGVRARKYRVQIG